MKTMEQHAVVRIARKSADKGRKLTAERWRRGVSEQKETKKEVDG